MLRPGSTLQWRRSTTCAAAHLPSEETDIGLSVDTDIDEAQLFPALFPALKAHVRINKRKGQFLLSGSVRFTSKADIRESLTGRIVSLELLPFTISGAAGVPLPDLRERLL
jgi:AAA domain